MTRIQAMLLAGGLATATSVVWIEINDVVGIKTLLFLPFPILTLVLAFLRARQAMKENA